MALTEAGKWLEDSLLNLSSDVRSGLQLDADLVYSLVSYCEMATPLDASEYLMNIVVDDRCKDIVAEYVRRRGGGPTSVPGETLQAYVKPREDESWSAGSKKPQKEKAEGNASAQKDADRTSSSSTATGATASQKSSTQKGKPAGGKGKRGGKGVSLAEASKGLVVFSRSGPCNCQCTRHKLINNCLSCGKIVCEQEGEGPCDFCGALVLREGSDYAGLEGVAVPPASEEEIKAEEFKNRLVEYDRSSAARTTVIDDQSDYFQIDGNTWLTDKEKQLLKKRQEDEERIAEERRKRVVVTIDLLGRKVVMAGQENGEDGGGSVSILGGDMFVGKDVANVPRIKPNPFLDESPVFVDWKNPAISSKSGQWAQNSSAAGRLAAKKSARIQHDDPIVEALIGHNLQDIGISNIDELNNAWQAPRANASAPVEEDEKFAECRSEMGGLGKGAVSTTNSCGPSHAEKKSSPQIFDICLPRKSGKHTPVVLAPSLIKQKQTDRKEAVSESYNRILRPGMILLKKWLSVDQQVDIVKQCKLLGTGPGGFYQPQYDENSKMHLRMMCLGMQWQPTSRAYETRRTNYDNALAPPLPESFLRLVEKAISVAKLLVAQESGGKSRRVVINENSPVPDMVPNVCIANFYEHSGNLGMHQDKDESSESLKRGRPVVSFSVGDSAEFIYGSDNNVETAEKLVLDSGDVLIFGGPSRMIYHGVPKIIRGSAPESLLHKSNLRPGRLNLTFRQN